MGVWKGEVGLGLKSQGSFTPFVDTGSFFA